MRIAPAQHRAYTYKVTVGPAKSAVSLTALKTHLKVSGTNQDTLISIYMNSAIDYAEKFTRRDFITRTYETFRDFFPGVSEGYYQFGDNPSFGNFSFNGGNLGFEIRRSPLQTIEKIQYLVSNVLTLVDSSIFYNTIEEDYSEVLTFDSNEWPTNADRRLQSVVITFKAGFGDADSDMPPWIAEGVFQHVAEMFANRGDCGELGDKQGLFLPHTARLIYLQNRIENL